MSEPRGIYDFTPQPPYGSGWTDFVDPAADTYRRKLDLAEFTEPRFYRPTHRAPLFQALRRLGFGFALGIVTMAGALSLLWAWARLGLPYWFRIELLPW